MRVARDSSFSMGRAEDVIGLPLVLPQPPAFESQETILLYGLIHSRI